MKNTENQGNNHFWWEKTGLRFECRECGRCCGGEPGFIWVTSKETEEIAAHLEVTVETLKRDYLIKHAGRTSIKELDNYDCVFLDSCSRRCKIYGARPMQCRLFPFWTSMLKDKKIWNFYSSICPGMNNGKLYTSEMIYSWLKLNDMDK